MWYVFIPSSSRYHMTTKNNLWTRTEPMLQSQVSFYHIDTRLAQNEWLNMMQIIDIEDRVETEELNRTNNVEGWDVDSLSAKVLVPEVVVSLLENFSNDHEVPWYHTKIANSLRSTYRWPGGLQYRWDMSTWIDATWSLAGSDWPASLEDSSTSSLSLISSTKLAETSSESDIPSRLASSVIGDSGAWDSCDQHMF